MPSSQGIFIEIIGDAKSYIRAAESTVAVNTKLAASLKATGEQSVVSSDVAAKARVSATAKSIAATREEIAAIERLISVQGKSEASSIALASAQSKLNRELGISSIATGRVGTAAKTAEVDLNKVVRGGLAGSGAFSALGRSLAFASSGFIAFAAGATIIAKSISAARELAVAQRQVNRQLETSGKTFKQYGAQIDSATGKLTHIAGFTKIDLLGAFGFAARATGNVSSSLKLLSIAADVARGRGLNLQSSMIALTKAVGGSSTALRRLGIIVPKTAKGWDAINFVAAKFAGQARAGTTATQRFSATLVTTEEIIGKALLPSVNKLVTNLGNWFQKMNETGRLQKDVNTIVKDAGDVLKTLAGAIKDVDKITGSFKNTLEALIALKFASTLAGWITSLGALAASWGNVAKAAEGAAAAQTTAIETGGAAGGLAGLRAGVGARLAGAAGTAASSALPLAAALIAFKIITNTPQYKAFQHATQPQGQSLGQRVTRDFGDLFTSLPADIHNHVITPLRQLNNFLQNDFGTSVPVNIQFLKNFRDRLFGGFPSQVGAAGAAGPFGSAQAHPQVSGFQLRITEQIAQAQAALTKSTTDDVKVARQIIARIKKIIDEGNYTQKGLLAILQAEGAALGVVQQAAAAAAAKRVAAIQAAKAKALAAFANLVDPLSVEVELLRAEAAGRSTLPALRKLLASARKALAQAKGLAQQQQALQQIVSIQGQIKSLSTQATVTFVESLKLQLALAKDQALGRNDTKDLLKLRHAILKFIHAHRHNMAALIDAYGQLAAVNAQLASSASSALGLFRTASTKLLTEGLGLTPDQRRRLRARLSQMGPGGTIPGEGTGAAGYAINPATGRPIVVHTHLNIDGKRVADNTTVHQQRHRRRNSHQRRGPNAGH